MKRKHWFQRIIALICCVIILPIIDYQQIDASAPSTSSTNYIRTYPISGGNDTPAYTNKECTQREGTIYAGDEVYIYELGQSNGVNYAYCSYPLNSGGRKYRYVKLSSFSPNNASGVNTARGKVNTYRRSNLTQQYGYTETGDTVWTIGRSGNAVQIIYTTGTLYKMGWVAESGYSAYINGSNDSNNETNNNTSNINQAAALVAKAKSQIGTKERSAGSDDIIYNDWYYRRRVNNNSGFYPWCATFVSWCANEVGILDSVIPKENGTTRMKDKLIENRKEALHLKGSGYHPVAGDIIFFGSNASQHVGIVEYSSGNTVYYIDGNNVSTTPHGVHASSCSLSYSNLYGFVTPNYAKVKTSVVEGAYDSASGGIESISVSGWTFDKGYTSDVLEVHVYIGGPAGTGKYIGMLNANVERKDVEKVYGNIGNHGFSGTLKTDKVGVQDVYVYGVNKTRNTNKLLGSKRVTIKMAETPKPTIKPTVPPTPTLRPTVVPTAKSTVKPTVPPTIKSTVNPTVLPTVKPTIKPTVQPIVTINPTTVPSPIVSTPSSVTVTTTPSPTQPAVNYPTAIPNYITTGSAVAGEFHPTPVPNITASPTTKPVGTTNPTKDTSNTQNNQKEDFEQYEEYEVEDETGTLDVGDTFEIRSVVYEVIDADEPAVELVAIEKSNIKSVSVPATVKYEGITYKVAGIGKSAFKNNKKITSLTIGNNVTYIGSYAFYKNTKLKKITIKSLKLEKVQKKAFWGLSKKVTVKLPVSKKANYKQMLKNAGLGK